MSAPPARWTRARVHGLGEREPPVTLERLPSVKRGGSIKGGMNQSPTAGGGGGGGALPPLNVREAKVASLTGRRAKVRPAPPIGRNARSSRGNVRTQTRGRLPSRATDKLRTAFFKLGG